MPTETIDTVQAGEVRRFELEDAGGGVRTFVAEDYNGGHAAAQRQALARIEGDGPGDGRLSLAHARPAAMLPSAADGPAQRHRPAPLELLEKVQQTGAQDYVRATLSGSPLAGAGRELNAELGIPERSQGGGVNLPRVAAVAGAVHGQRVSLAALSTAAGDVDESGTVTMPLRNQPLLDAIGVRPSPVMSGRQRFVRVSKEPSAAQPDETKALTSGDFQLSWSDLVPRRVAAATTNTVEASAVNEELAAVAVATMMGAVAEAQQSSIVATLLAVKAVDDVGSVLTYASGRKVLASSVDGQITGRRGDVALVVGADTYALMDSLVPATGATDMSLLDFLEMKSAGVHLSRDVAGSDGTSKNQLGLAVVGSPTATGSYRFVEWASYELFTANPTVGTLGANTTLLLQSLYAFSVLPDRSFRPFKVKTAS